eukprot:6182607-Pleurochrysis_carterae.AAC.1
MTRSFRLLPVAGAAVSARARASAARQAGGRAPQAGLDQAGAARARKPVLVRRETLDASGLTWTHLDRDLDAPTQVFCRDCRIWVESQVRTCSLD